MGIWRKIRIVLFVLSFIQGFLCGILGVDDILANEPFAFGLFFVILPILFMPTGLLFVIGIQFINPLQDKKWTLPNFDSNFFNLKDPLHFFHAVAYFLTAAGIGTIIGSLFNSLSSMIVGLGLLSGSFGVLLGVKLCIKVYGKKFREGHEIQSTRLRKRFVVKKTVKIIGVLMVLAAIVAILVGTFSLIKTQDFIAKAVKTEGAIVELDRKNSGNGIIYSPVFSFTDPSGKEHITHSSLGANPPRYEVGEKVLVLYTAQNPEKAQINSFMNLYFIPLITGIIGALNLSIGLIAIFLVPAIINRTKGSVI